MVRINKQEARETAGPGTGNTEWESSYLVVPEGRETVLDSVKRIQRSAARVFQWPNLEYSEPQNCNSLKHTEY